MNRINRANKRKKLPCREAAGLSPARTGLLAIADVDVDIGMLNSGGNPQVYRKVLSDFCRDAGEREERIRCAAREEKAALYILLLHALKDASADIGAIGLARRAMWLADAAKNEDFAELRAGTDALLRTERMLTWHILSALARGAPQEKGRVIRIDRIDR
ncbi:MAG: hypothetical protein LBP73_03065 [Clostridiales Family XIII bacterium]|jgi:HPt (histidine-containing phosphotransfer) domain-containing protein|nr:hypothetical protein [Clostridiales Family XIII bacterium]